MKRSNEQTLKSALDAWLRETRLGTRLQEHQLKQRWEELFGKTIAKYTRSISVRNRTLFLGIDAAPLRQEMMYNKQLIIDRINGEIAEGMINEVVIK